MEDFLLGLLYIIAEALLEVLLEIAGEAIIALISRALGEMFTVFHTSSEFLITVGYFLMGSATGFLSLFLFPHPLIHPSKIHGISLLVSPLITGLLMSQVGSAVRRRGQQAVQIESFGYGFMFALGMALVRFFFVK